MKIKRFLIVLMITVLSLAVLAGCDVVTKNEERDYNQVLVTVNYAGLSSTVTKGEFIESYSSIGYYYVMYYGYSVEEAAKSILDSLADRELLLLYVRTKLAESKGVSNGVAISELLTATEVNEAVKAANETMQTTFNSIYEELLSEKIATLPELEDEPEEEEEEETTDTPRPSRPDMAEAEIDYTSETVEDPDNKFFEKAFEYTGESTDKSGRLTAADYAKIVTKSGEQLKKQLADNYRDYNYYLEKQYETQMLSKYQRNIGTTFENLDAIDELVAAERARIIASNKELFARNAETNYNSALSSDLYKLIYHPESEQGSGYVYNILFKFSDEQTTALNNFKKDQTDADVIAAYRKILSESITVNVTNPDYDAEATIEDCTAEENQCTEDTPCDDPNCPTKLYSEENVPVADIIARMTTELADAASFEAKRETFIKWLYLVNDDSGMYDTNNNNALVNGNKGYLVSADEKSSSWVDEFTALGRTLVDGTSDVELGVGTELVSASNGLGAYGYCVTDYGIHFMFVSYIPFNTAEGANADTDEISNDYVIYYGRYEDENDPSLTLEEAIIEAMKTAYIDKQYEEEMQTVIAANASGIAKNEKVYKKLMKEIVGD